MAIEIIDPSRPGLDHVPSYWAASLPHSPELGAPLIGDREADIAIIGGGYTGLSTAYHLAKEYGLRAHVLEAHRIGWGCSGRNGGFASVGFGKSGPADWARRYGLTAAGDIFRQSREAVRLVRRILNEEAIDAEATPEGGLELAHRANRLPGMAAYAEDLARRFDFPIDILDKVRLQRDYLDSREAHGALLYGEGFALHALKYALGLAGAAQRRGAILHEASPVLAWSRDRGRHVLKTPQGNLRAERVVIAGNGYTGDRLHGVTRGRLLPVLSNIIVTRPLSEAEIAATHWRTQLKIWDSRNLLFYYRLLPDRRILFGARGGIEDSAASRAWHRAWLERRLGEMFPPLAGIGSEYFWNGWVCVTRDRSPHLGAVEAENVFYALGYIGNGVAPGTYCGRLLAERLAGRGEATRNPLLEEDLPRFPFPALRRLYQRAIYLGFALADRV